MIDDPRLPPPLPPHADWSVPSVGPTPQLQPISQEALAAAGIRPFEAVQFISPLNAACIEFDIITPVRAGMFLAQVAWESGRFRYLCEIWGPTPAQLRYPGGRQWSGHGLIQITHESNHREQAEHFGISMDGIVAWLQTPEGASRSAAYYWYTRNCNALADAGNFSGVTKKINGGYNDLDKRLAIFNALIPVMGIA